MDVCRQAVADVSICCDHPAIGRLWHNLLKAILDRFVVMVYYVFSNEGTSYERRIERTNYVRFRFMCFVITATSVNHHLNYLIYLPADEQSYDQCQQSASHPRHRRLRLNSLASRLCYVKGADCTLTGGSS